MKCSTREGAIDLLHVRATSAYHALLLDSRKRMCTGKLAEHSAAIIPNQDIGYTLSRRSVCSAKTMDVLKAES